MHSPVILIIATLLLIFAASWSVWLIRPSKKRFSWILLSAGFSCIAIIQIIDILPVFIDSIPSFIADIVDWLTLLIALLLAVGVILIGDVFFSMSKEERNRIESENRFRTLFNNSNDQVYVIDLYGNFVEVNQVMIDLLDYSKEKFMNMHIRDIKSPKFADTTNTLLDKIKIEGRLIFESEHISSKGRIYPVEVNSRIIEYSNGKAVLSMARDITERKQTERKIVNAIIETEEREKERFAKDLHDGLGTLLSSINIYISLLKSGQVEESEKENILDYTKGLIDEAILNAKEIANNLRPNIISRFGLVAAVNSLCEKINKTGIMKIEFTANKIKSEDLNKDLEVTLYRIINELINNALNHASADAVKINLFREFNMIKLIFSDNGIGFNVEEVMNRKSGNSMGLSNIMSRVDAINGFCKINSTPEKGTEVIINVKL